MISFWSKPKNINLKDTVTRISLNTGSMFDIRHLSEEFRGEAVELVMKLCLTDDPVLRALGISADLDSTASLKEWIEKYLSQNITYGCFMLQGNSDSVKLVAVDVLHVRTNNDQPQEMSTVKSQQFKIFLRYLQTVEKHLDIFNRYGVLKYISSFGLLVLPEYRNLIIETEMIKMRQKVSVVLGIEVITSVFGDKEMQNVAHNYGYKVLFEIP